MTTDIKLAERLGRMYLASEALCIGRGGNKRLLI
jgi:hypothetical protein